MKKNAKKKMKNLEKPLQHNTSFIGGILQCSCGWVCHKYIQSYAQVEKFADDHKLDK
jgi:hypothetical protein